MRTKAKKSNERLSDAIVEMAHGLYDIGAIDALTMREYSSINIPDVQDFTPIQIKKIRLREKVSQAIFAKFLNTTIRSVQDWEQGKKHPRGTSLKLLNMVYEKGLAILA